MLGSNTSQQLLRESYSVGSKPKATIEWNHNVYNRPRVTGTVIDSSTSTIPYLKTASFATNNVQTLTALGAVSFLASSPRGAIDCGGLSESFTITSLGVIPSVAFSFGATSSNGYKISFFVKLSDVNSNAVTLHFSELNSSGIEISGSSKAFDADNIDWQLHKFIYKPTNDLTTSVAVYISTQQDTISNVSTVNISDLTVCLVNSQEHSAYPTFNTDSVFEGFRPGDEIAETNMDSGNRPLSKVIYNGLGKQKVYGNAVLHVSDTVMKDSDSDKVYLPGLTSLKYYAYNQSYEKPAQGVFAYYDKSLTTNKLVIKMLNSGPGTLNSYYGNTIIDYDLYTYNSSSNVWTKYTKPGTMGKNGSLILYWNGSTWNGTATTSTINESDYTLSGTTTIDGIAFIIKDMGETSTSMLSLTSAIDTTVRFLEISPRLIIDFTDYIESFSASKETDSGSLPVPVGLATSNNAELVLENLSRTYSGVTFGIFSDRAQQYSPITKLNLIDKNAKVRIKFDLLDSAGSTVESDILFFTGYIDTWTINNDNATISLFDYSKFLQKKVNNNILLLSEKAGELNVTLSNVLSEILEQNGFSDYNTPSLSNTYLDYFYTNDQKTLWETIQDLFTPYQIIGTFDENGIFNSYTYASKSTNITDGQVSFIFTDKNNGTDSSSYIANIIKLNENNGESPGKIVVNYSKSYTHSSVAEGSSTKTSSTTQASTDILWTAQENENLGYSILKSDISSTTNIIPLNTQTWEDKNEAISWSQYSGYGIIGTEIIKFNGLEVSASDQTYVVKSAADLQYLKAKLSTTNTNTTSKLTFSYTGRLMNVERGLFGTSAQKHSASTLISDVSSSYPSLTVNTVSNVLNGSSAGTSVSLAKSTAVTKKSYTGFLQLIGQTAGVDTIAFFDQKDSDGYNKYSYHFYTPYDSKTKEDDLISFHIGYNSSSPKDCITVQLICDSYTGTRVSSVYFRGKQVATSNFKLDSMDPAVTKKVTKNNKTTTTTVKKAVTNKYNLVLITLSDNNELTVTANGKTVWRKVIIAKDFTRANTSIGISVRGKNKVFVDSIYASNSNSLVVSDYNTHVDTQTILYGGNEYSTKPFFFSLFPGVYGMQVFDVITSGPAFNQKVLKTVGQHSLYNSSTKKTKLLTIPESNSIVSGIAHNPFRSKFIYINIAEAYMPLGGNQSFNPVKLYGNAIIKTEDQQYTKDLDSQLSNANDIQISSDWIQYDNNAKTLASALARQIKISGNTIDIEAFGNPLITVGDTVKILHYQSNIVKTDQYYMVVKSNTSYNNGFNSSFTVRRIK
jgi:hypothetical protein